VVRGRIGIELDISHNVGIRLDVLVVILADCPWVCRDAEIMGCTATLSNVGLQNGEVGVVVGLHLTEATFDREPARVHGSFRERLGAPIDRQDPAVRKQKEGVEARRQRFAAGASFCRDGGRASW
jgi:hypothetical protein